MLLGSWRNNFSLCTCYTEDGEIGRRKKSGLRKENRAIAEKGNIIPDSALPKLRKK